MNDVTIYNVHQRFKRVVTLAVEFERVPRPFGTEEQLTSVEIHLA